MKISRNANLYTARINKNDEFYTKYSDIHDEVINYRELLKDKVIYCNADDPYTSNFVKYFIDNFEELEIKYLISTNYSADVAYLSTYDGVEHIVSELVGDGDFRSDEVREYIIKSDVVITNPPFSLFRDFIELMISLDKKFLVIGGVIKMYISPLFQLFISNELSYGFNKKIKEFAVPDDTIINKNITIGVDGIKYQKFGNIGWFTNLLIPDNEYIPLVVDYDERQYEEYDNYYAINIDRVAKIPKDYYGIMGVPVTFLTKHDPNQFEIVGIADRHNSSGLKTKIYTKDDALGYSCLNGSPVIDIDGVYVKKFTRLLIKRV